MGVLIGAMSAGGPRGGRPAAVNRMLRGVLAVSVAVHAVVGMVLFPAVETLMLALVAVIGAVLLFREPLHQVVSTRRSVAALGALGSDPVLHRDVLRCRGGTVVRVVGVPRGPSAAVALLAALARRRAGRARLGTGRCGARGLALRATADPANLRAA